METDHLCIGGGPAGVFAALTAAEHGKRCIILEHNKQLGRKLRITGKGRCNLTNNCDRDTLMANIPANGKFLYSAFSRCTPQDVMAYFEKLGVPLKTERGNRVFPVSDRAEDIVQALQKAVRLAGIPVVHGDAAELLLENGRCTGVRTADGREYRAGTTLLATGGMSYPKTGSDGSGYRLAETAGHTIVPPMPSLIPLVTQETWCQEAMGLSLRNVILRLYRGNKCIFEELGEMLFTHFGVSGPLVLSASALMRKGSPQDYRLEIDLKSGLTPEQLDKRIQRDLADSPNRDLGNILHALLPAKLILRCCGWRGSRRTPKPTPSPRHSGCIWAAASRRFPCMCGHSVPLKKPLSPAAAFLSKKSMPAPWLPGAVRGCISPERFSIWTDTPAVSTYKLPLQLPIVPVWQWQNRHDNFYDT